MPELVQVGDMGPKTHIFIKIIAVKTFFTFFYILVTFFAFFNVFYFSNVFLFQKNVGKVQSGKQINNKHFQNNSSEIQWIHK